MSLKSCSPSGLRVMLLLKVISCFVDQYVTPLILGTHIDPLLFPPPRKGRESHTLTMTIKEHLSVHNSSC